MTTNLVLATKNPGKVREFRALFWDLPRLRVHALDEVGKLPDVVEDGKTFEENAIKKAREIAAATGMLALADDSGLEVDALGGAPGVHSARYAGVEGTRAERDRANNEKLLRALADTPDRRARFVCAMCLVDARGQVLFETRGTYEGVIAEAARGESGFGYDPLLFLPELGKTSAQLSPAEKGARSHRGVAARALAAYLEKRGAA